MAAKKRTRRTRPSRSKDALKLRGEAAVADNISVALEARMRQRGISRKAALDQKNGSELGRLLNSEEISTRQYDAANKWEKLDRKYKTLIDARRLAARSGIDFERHGSGTDPDDPEQIDRYLRIKERHNAARRAILESGPFGHMAIQLVIDADKPAKTLIGDLRLALNALVRIFYG